MNNEWTITGEGARRRVVQDGEKLMLVEFHFEPGAIGAEHSHPHEQITYLVRGRVRFMLSGQEIELSAGQSLLIPSNATHGLVALEETLLVDTFSPPREDFRPKTE